MVLVPVGLFIAVVSTAAASGSYFPSSWGWASLAFLWAAAIGLVAQRRVALGTLEVAYLGAWLVLLAWTAASLLWSPTTTQTMYEVERTVVYVSFAFALAVLARRSVQLLLPALLAGIVAVAAYALATRLLPDRVGSFDSYVGYRLSEPLGYWNALSVFVAVGIVVAVGLAARGQALVVRALSAASLVLLFPVLYFTFGRGGWIALVAGLAVAVAVDPRRLQLVTTLLVIAPWPALAVWRAYESPSLTTQFSALADASDEGKRLALTIAVLAVVSALVMTGYALLADRITVGRGVRRAYGAVLVLALVGSIAAGDRRLRGTVGVRPPRARLDQAVLAERQRRSDEAALQSLLERPPGHVGVRAGGRARAPGRRLGCRHVRAVVARAPGRADEGPRRARPLRRDARRARPGRPGGAVGHRRHAARRRESARAGVRSSPRRWPASWHSRCTRGSTGTGKCRPS